MPTSARYPQEHVSQLNTMQFEFKFLLTRDVNIFGAQVCGSLHVALGKYKSSSGFRAGVNEHLLA